VTTVTTLTTVTTVTTVMMVAMMEVGMRMGTGMRMGMGTGMRMGMGIRMRTGGALVSILCFLVEEGGPVPVVGPGVEVAVPQCALLVGGGVPTPPPCALLVGGAGVQEGLGVDSGQAERIAGEGGWWDWWALSPPRNYY
jgi:hypothetical protein